MIANVHLSQPPRLGQDRGQSPCLGIFFSPAASDLHSAFRFSHFPKANQHSTVSGTPPATTPFAYDAANPFVSEQDGTPRTVRFACDSCTTNYDYGAFRRASNTADRHRNFTFAYNARGQLTGATNPEGGAFPYDYDTIVPVKELEFLCKDPMGFVDGPNLYAYVMQNPWTSFDPDGLKKKEDYQKEIKTHRKQLESKTKNILGGKNLSDKAKQKALDKVNKEHQGAIDKAQAAIDRIDESASSINAFSKMMNEAAEKMQMPGRFGYVDADKLDDSRPEDMAGLYINAGLKGIEIGGSLLMATVASEGLWAKAGAHETRGVRPCIRAKQRETPRGRALLPDSCRSRSPWDGRRQTNRRLTPQGRLRRAAQSSTPRPLPPLRTACHTEKPRLSLST
jgi:YD repeat-containing protein